MNIVNLKAQNIFSISNINQDLEDLGLVLVTGYSHDEGSANGAGKSSFSRNALIWGLYGKTMGGAKGDDVINRHRSGNCSVSITFKSKSSDYIITRTRDPNSLSLLKDGTDISSKLEKDTQENIDTIIGRDFKSFIQTNFFGQGRKLSFMELTPADQRAVIGSILPFDSLKEWEDYSREVKKKLELLLNKKELLASKLTGQKEVLEKEINSLQREVDSFEEKRDNKIQALRDKEKFLIIDDEYKTDKTEVELLKKKFELEEFIKDTEKKLYRIDLSAFKVEHAEVEKRISRVKANPSTCPTCNQPVPDLSNYSSDLEKKLEKIKAFIDTKEKEERELQEALSFYNTEKQQIHKNLSYTYSKNQSEEIQEKINKIKKETNVFEPRLQDNKKQLEGVDQKLAEVLSRKKELAEELHAVSIWIKAFSTDLKNILFNQACPYLENKTNRYLQILNNSQISVEFSTERKLKGGETKKDFNVSVESKTGANQFELLSGGEQQIVNFAVGLALSDLAESQTAGQTNLMVLDEPFTNLDSRNAESVISFLTQDLKKRRSTILLVSNEDNLKNLVPSRIHIEKRSGLSRIKDG